MRWPRVRSPIGRFLIGVAILAVILALTTDHARPARGAIVLAAAGLIAASGFWAARHPWIACGAGVVIFLATPTVDHPGLIDLLIGLGCLTLFIGAGADLAPRLLKRLDPH